MSKRYLSDHRLEETWLAALLLHPEYVPVVMSITDKDSIVDHNEYRALWRSMKEMYRQKITIDPASLASHATTRGYLSEHQTDEAIGQLVTMGGSAANIESWTEQIIDLSRLRDAFMLGGDLQEMVGNPKVSVDRIIDEVTRRLSDSTGIVRPDKVGDVAREMLSDLKQGVASGTIHQGLMTGMVDIDIATGGLEPDDYFGIAARPGVGKTSLGLQVARNIILSRDSGVVLFFSLEMGEKRLVRRLASSISGVDYKKIRSHSLTGDEMIKVQAAFEIIEKWKDRLLIYTSRNFNGGPSAEKICMAIKSAAMQHEVICSFVDNFNLLPAKNTADHNDNSRRFKNSTLEVRSPIFLLIQLRRDTVKDNRAPIISDIKDSGQVEQDLDRLLLMDREDKRNKHIPELWDEFGIRENIMGAHLAKNRDGESVHFEMEFNGPTMEFITPSGPPPAAQEDDLSLIF